MRLKGTLPRQVVREIERYLKRRRAELAGAGRRMMAPAPPGEAGRSADLMDWASASALDELQAALIDRHRGQVAQIEEALARLARGKYGICWDCGEAIGLGRLRALPFAQRCTCCQSRAEHQARPSRRDFAPILVAADGA